MKTRLNNLSARMAQGSAWAVCCLLLATPARAEDPPATEKKTEAPATHEVRRGSLKAKVQLDGVFESAEMAPVKITPKAWNDLTVLESVAHGSRVEKGDTLVKLDLEKLEDQIADLENERPGSKIALELANAELANMKETTPNRLEAARRGQKNAAEDYEYFQTVSRAQKEKSAAFNLKGAEQRLEGAREELAQLEKMYKADDLTEETEEIIVKRQRFAVEAAEFALEATKLNINRDLRTTIPREHETLKLAKSDQELALQLAEQSLPRNLAKKKLDLEKLKRDQKKGEKRLNDLKADLAGLTIKAPMDGVVYYGACENGKWPAGAVVAKKLIPGGKLSPQEVFITIVNPAKMIVRTVVPEAELQNIRTDLKGEASPAMAPDRKLPVQVAEVGVFPMPSGGFEATLSFEARDGLKLAPGMNCKISFNDIEKPNLLVVPKDAVFTENTQKVVYLAKNDGKHEKRTVKTGASDDQRIEITEGLAEGDKIFLKKPEKE